MDIKGVAGLAVGVAGGEMERGGIERRLEDWIGEEEAKGVREFWEGGSGSGSGLLGD